VADAVRSAGGWLFDQVIAGWSGTVLTTDHADPRPLRILGAGAVDLESALGAPGWGLRPDAIAVDADLCESDPRVGRLVCAALADGVSDVRLWGAGTGDGSRLIQHRLSVAARAFKAQALAAAAAADPIEATEAFRGGRLLRAVHTGRPAVRQHA
jgi:hypothetical protein